MIRTLKDLRILRWSWSRGDPLVLSGAAPFALPAPVAMSLRPGVSYAAFLIFYFFTLPP